MTLIPLTARKPMLPGRYPGTDWTVVDGRQWSNGTRHAVVLCRCACGHEQYVRRQLLVLRQSKRCRTCAGELLQRTRKAEPTATTATAADPYREPTLAELDALIAERMKNLPKGWVKPRAKPVPWVVPVVRQDRRHNGRVM